MRLAPGGDVIVVVAVGDRAADRQQQHLRQRMRHTPRIARVLDLRKMLQKRRQPRLLRERRRDRAHGRSEEHESELQSLMRISYSFFCLTQTKKSLHKYTLTIHK